MNENCWYYGFPSTYDLFLEPLGFKIVCWYIKTVFGSDHPTLEVFKYFLFLQNEDIEWGMELIALSLSWIVNQV